MTRTELQLFILISWYMRTKESITAVWSFAFGEQHVQQVWCTLCCRSRTPLRACRCGRCYPRWGTAAQRYDCWILFLYSRSRSAPSQPKLQSTWGKQELLLMHVYISWHLWRFVIPVKMVSTAQIILTWWKCCMIPHSMACPPPAQTGSRGG